MVMDVLQWITFILGVVATLHHNHIGLMGASNVGVCYGMQGNDIHATTEVINLYKEYGIGKMRLFDPDHAALEALRGNKPVIQNGNLKYYCLFDAIMDAFLAAMAKANNGHVRVLVSESGLPLDGNGNFTTPELAMTYNTNFMYQSSILMACPRVTPALLVAVECSRITLVVLLVVIIKAWELKLLSLQNL
ncbi:hypothetical protein ACLB2K_000739 [Fragaria x ananassa]